MSYAHFEYKDEDDIRESYTQQQLEMREDFLNELEGVSTELIYEPKEFRPADKQILLTLIGDVPTFKEAFKVCLKQLAEIFFTIDPYDLIPIAVDLLDHFMPYHKPDKLPFDPSSGRSSSLYMSMIREEEDIKLILASEDVPEDDDDETPAVVESPTPVPVFFSKVHSIISKYKMSPDRVYQLELLSESYRAPDYVGKAPWDDDYDREGGIESASIRICVNADGAAVLPFVSRDYDLNSESFPTFLAELKNLTKASKRRPILLLTCRRIKAFSMDVIYYCRQNGIKLLAFPAFSKNQPLSKHVTPLFKRRFAQEYTSNYKTAKETLSTPAGVAALMRSILDKILAENVASLKTDFRRCLKLDSCFEYPDLLMDTDDNDNVDPEPPSSSIHMSSQELLVKGLKIKQRKPQEDEHELNEFMFAQIGPLKASDYY